MSYRLFRPFVSLFLALTVLFAGVTPALAAPPLNDNFADAEVITLLPFSFTVDVSEATNELDEPHFCAFMEKSTWFAFTPATTTFVQTDIQGSIGFGLMNVYQANGPAIFDLNFKTCVGLDAPYTFVAVAEQTYYLQVGTITGFDGSITVNLEQLPAPANDNFADAISIGSVPFSADFDFSGATVESGEPAPTSCIFDPPPFETLWYFYSPTQDESLLARMSPSSGSPFLGVYSGTDFNNMTELGCAMAGGAVSFEATAGQTYYFQVGSYFEEIGGATFILEPTPPPVADFFTNVGNGSIYDTVHFFNNSFDPANIGISIWEWDFGDGSTSTEIHPFHQYSSDGDYLVTLTVQTFDSRTGSTSQTIEIRTHDVSIANVSAPRAANVGQTKAITISLRNSRYPETVRIELYRSVAGGGFELVSNSTQFIPVRSGNRATQFSFNYTFQPQDAQIGKVTFKAMVFIENANDAAPGDNEAISTPPTAVKR